MDDVMQCPLDDCDLPAVVVMTFVLWSTDGPVPMLRVECFAGHGRVMPAPPPTEEDAA